MPDKLSTYNAKRNFEQTPEPRGDVADAGAHLRFVVQKHHARQLHYDFRLELDGTLKSWAVPKGPSLDPGEKRLAVHVEDHPLDYLDFEGDIPPSQYGAGHVEVWDTGHWEPQGDALADYQQGKLKFRLDGEKLHGGWALVRTRLQASSNKEQWLLIKEKDEQARPVSEYDITEALPESVLRAGPSHSREREAMPKQKEARAARKVRDRAGLKTGQLSPDTLPDALIDVLTNAPGNAEASRTAGSSGRRATADILEGVRITHAERVLDPDSGATKFDLAHYYQQIAPLMLPFLQNRPVYLMRAPDGVSGERFFQKHITRMKIPGARPLDVPLLSGRHPLMAVESAHALVGAAQMDTIELHIPNVTADRIDRPDCMVFDLDPDPDLPWSAVVEGAQLTRAAVDELGLRSFLKTSGGKGLHLVIPLARRHDWDTVNAFSRAVAQHLARTLPQRFSAKMGAQNRIGKIFVDYLRNNRSASTIAPYAVRARAQLPVAVPLAWDELSQLTSSAQWTIAALPELLARAKKDPWTDYFNSRQMLTAAMKKKIGMK